MATQALRRGEAPLWAGRVLEWVVLGCVVLFLIALLGQRVRVVQGQGELAAVRGTLGALRTALVIHHVQQSVAGPDQAGQTVAQVQRNPFELLARRPINYLGEARAAQATSVVPGSWVFDPVCVCVGYAPLHGEWLDSPSGSDMVWWQVSAPPGPLQLSAREIYGWQGQQLD